MSIVCECHSILYSNNDHNGLFGWFRNKKVNDFLKQHASMLQYSINI